MISTDDKWDEKYEKVCTLGKGTYGTVYQAKHVENNNFVAIKKMKLENEAEGIPATTMREIAILKKLNHDNILSFKHIKFMNDRILLCFDYFPYDLKNFISQSKGNKNFDEKTIAKIMLCILRGLDYLHSQRVLHRDLKPHNILIDPEKSRIQIADFGLSRVFNIPIRPYTKEILTLWYRAPELLLGCTEYSIGVDIWSMGCIFGELFLKGTLFRKDNEVEQTKLILHVLGGKEEDMLCYTKLDGYNKEYRNIKGIGLAKYMQELNVAISPDALDLMGKMLEMDPSKRICARDAMDHKFFSCINN